MSNQYNKSILYINFSGFILGIAVFIFTKGFFPFNSSITELEKHLISIIFGIIPLFFSLTASMIAISYETKKTYNLVNENFLIYKKNIDEHQLCNEDLSKTINSFTEKSSKLFDVLPHNLISNTKNIIDGVIDLIEADCAHLTCVNKCHFDVRNCIYKFFLIKEINRLKLVKKNIESEVYYIDSNDPTSHEEIVNLMKRHGIVSYNVIHYIGNGAENGDANDESFLRRLLGDAKDLEINWLFLHSTLNNFDIKSSLASIRYVIDIMNSQIQNIKKNNIDILFKYCHLKEFTVPHNAKGFVDSSYPDVGIYCEKKLRQEATLPAGITRTFYFASKTKKANTTVIRKYVFVKNNSVEKITDAFIKVWSNNVISTTIDLNEILKL